MTAPRCGTTAGYSTHRREGTPTCQPCKDAQAAWQRTYEKRRYLTHSTMLVDATGTARRIRALVAIGWPLAQIEARCNLGDRNVHRLLRRRRVHSTTAAKVAALYDELWMIPGPSVRARRLAARNAWPSPLAWDDDRIDDPRAYARTAPSGPRAFDEVAVARAMRGDPVHLRPVEKAEAVRRMTAAGLSAATIAARLRMEQRSVVRLRRDRPDERQAG